jgi:mono/diheme cytochrome c family protein
MLWKRLLLLGLVLLVSGFIVLAVSGQDEQQFEEVHIFTTASRVVGVGTYVAAEAYGVAAGEDPAEAPAQAIIMPYGIYPTMGVETIEDFVQPAPAVEGFTFVWSLEPPDGSAAELITGTVAIFMADVEGEYLLTLTATDPNGNVGEATWPVWATSYVGSGYLEGPSTDETQCIDCHEDVAENWLTTGHASMFTRAIDGEASDHYSASCVSCHTTGFNNQPEAVNGGWDDIVADAGWMFPEELVPGNWDTLVAEYPEIAGMANVQCESCHGPGYAHVFEATRSDSMIGLGLEYGVCAQCHAEEPYHIYPQQWENSAHADKSAQAFWYPVGEERASCVRCHSGAGYIDFANGLPAEEQRTNYQPITCAVCHDPHDANNPNQLRVFDSVTLPNGTEVADTGPAATCMSCHNARRDGVAIVDGMAEGGSFSTPHYSTAAELMNATGGYTWGEVLPTSTHGRAVDDSCIGCHMAAGPGMDADGAALPGHNEVGGHSFAMVSADGVENVAVCQRCHDAAESFAFEARRDYDGDGVIETNQAEVEGLQALLETAVVEAGVTLLDHHPYVEIPEGASADVYGAVWNMEFSGSSGSAVHNLRYTVALLQLSYQKLTGEPVPNAVILSPK